MRQVALHNVPLITRRMAIVLVEVLAVCFIKLLRRFRGADAKVYSDAVTVIGFLESASGLGAAARGLTMAIADWSPLKESISSLSPSATIKADDNSDISVIGDIKPAPVSLCAIHIYNPDVFARLIILRGIRVLTRNRRNLLIVNWETGVIPRRWKRIVSCYDVLAAPSVFTAAAVRCGTGRQVYVVPNCVVVKGKRTLKEESTHFQFLVVCDSLSSLSRKNPQGALKAFRLASLQFPAGVTASLCVKCNEGISASALADLRQEAEGLNVSIIAQTLETEAMEQLWERTDCVISMHRSEGFGLVVAEALSRGVPVIATRQGGILDFVDDDSCYLIEGVAVSGANYLDVYEECSEWVEPNVGHAADSIVHVVTNYGEALRRAEAGYDTVSRLLSPGAVRDALRKAMEGAPST